MTFKESVEISATPEVVFDVSQDYARRLAWDPFLKEARLEDEGATVGPGSRVTCVARNGQAMETRYVSYQPPTVCAVEMTRGPWFIRSFAGSWRFEPVDGGITRVDFIYNLVARPRVLTGLIGSVFARDTRRRLAGLKRAIESRAIV
jgi:ribosome-associated toxin RatA of RatAB toxin-antitoxin module